MQDDEYDPTDKNYTKNPLRMERCGFDKISGPTDRCVIKRTWFCAGWFIHCQTSRCATNTLFGRHMSFGYVC